MRKALLVLAFAFNTFAAGPLLVGGRGGAGLTTNGNAVTGLVGLSTRQYLIGPTVGFRMPLGLSVEGDALFNRQTLNLPRLPFLNGLSTHADSWEFPIMLKLTPGGESSIAPVLGAGFSVRRIHELTGVSSILVNGSTNATTYGFVAGAGLRFRSGPLDITPEVRYTRWQSTGLTQSLLNAVWGNQNQVQALVGFTF